MSPMPWGEFFVLLAQSAIAVTAFFGVLILVVFGVERLVYWLDRWN
jgi:hypothetical protein